MTFNGYYQSIPPFETVTFGPYTPAGGEVGGNHAISESIETPFHPNSSYEQFPFQRPLPPAAQNSPSPPKNLSRSLDSGLGMDPEDGRHSSVEKDMTLTESQLRRKSQNRAAQRAFRERKERHVKELESRLKVLERNTNSLASENEALKLKIERLRTENEVLRAMGDPYSSPTPGHASGSFEEGEDSKIPGGQHSGTSRKIRAAQTWDVLQANPLVKQGRVDITEVSSRVKKCCQSDEAGRYIYEHEIHQIVEAARRTGGDELL